MLELRHSLGEGEHPTNTVEGVKRVSVLDEQSSGLCLFPPPTSIRPPALVKNAQMPGFHGETIQGQGHRRHSAERHERTRRNETRGKVSVSHAPGAPNSSGSPRLLARGGGRGKRMRELTNGGWTLGG